MSILVRVQDYAVISAQLVREGVIFQGKWSAADEMYVITFTGGY